MTRRTRKRKSRKLRRPKKGQRKRWPNKGCC